MVALTGVSGAGKSTLLNLIGGLDQPTSGDIMFRGKNLRDFSDGELNLYRCVHMGFVFQFHHLLSEFSALENVMIPGRIAGKTPGECLNEAEELLRFVGLADRMRHLPRELSGGERQRVAVARALINRPDLVLADEPSGNLDERKASLLHELFVRLNKEFRQTFLIVTHDRRLAALAGRIANMADGIVEN